VGRRTSGPKRSWEKRKIVDRSAFARTNNWEKKKVQKGTGGAIEKRPEHLGGLKKTEFCKKPSWPGKKRINGKGKGQGKGRFVG